MATPEPVEMNVRLTATDELSPVLRGIQSEFGELLEVKYDWRIPLGSFVGGFGGALAAILLSLSL